MPPLLWAALSAPSNGRYLALYWSDIEDEPVYDDGRRCGPLAWDAFLTWVNSAMIAAVLWPHRGAIGMRGEDATHALVVDRDNNELYLVPMIDALVFVSGRAPSRAQVWRDRLTRAWSRVIPYELRRGFTRRRLIVDDLEAWLHAVDLQRTRGYSDARLESVADAHGTATPATA